jgi:hypothetical protein
MKIDRSGAAARPRLPFFGVHGGLKSRGRRDFASSPTDWPPLLPFTRNRAAAPVVVAREHVADGRIQAIMINSGNANAATGEGLARGGAVELGSRLAIDPALVLPADRRDRSISRRSRFRAISAVDGLSCNGFGAARATATSDASAGPIVRPRTAIPRSGRRYRGRTSIQYGYYALFLS